MKPTSFYHNYLYICESCFSSYFSLKTYLNISNTMGKYLKYRKIFKTSKRINLCILIFPRTHTCIFNNVIKLSQLKFAWYVHFSTWNLFYAKNSFSLFISYHSFRHHIHCFVLPICIFRNRNTFPPISSVWFIFSINLQLLILVAFHLFFYLSQESLLFYNFRHSHSLFSKQKNHLHP